MKYFEQKSEIVFGSFLIIFIFLLKYPILNLPYSWDVMNYIIPAAQYIYENGFSIFLWEYSNGHPPFYFVLLGFVFKLFGNTQFVSHLVTVFFSFLSVYYTYLLGKFLFNRKIGIIASLLMFFYPTFFSYSGLSYLAMPLTALTIISIYYFVKGKISLYIIFSSLLVLTKERGIFVPAALLFYDVIKNRKINIRKQLILAIPLFVFGLWLLSNRLYYGSFLYPLNSTLFSPNIILFFLNIFVVLKSLFFDYNVWILTSLLFLSCFSFKLIKKNKNLFYYLIPSFILFLLLFISPNFSPYLEKYFPNIINYLLILKNFSFLFSIILFLFLLSFKKFINFWNNKKLYPFYTIFIFMFLSYILFSPFPARYGLPIYPIIFILFSVSLVKLFKKYSYLVFLILLVLFFVQWGGDSNKVGFALENNMEYVDSIKTHQMAVNYLEENFPDSVVLVSYPQSLELKYSYLGYVDKPLNVVSIPPFPGLTTKNSTIYLNPSKYSKEIDLNTIDLIYYSEQQFDNKNSKELREIFDEKLIKRFEINGKIVEIYEINQNIEYPNYNLPLD